MLKKKNTINQKLGVDLNRARKVNRILVQRVVLRNIPALGVGLLISIILFPAEGHEWREKQSCIHARRIVVCAHCLQAHARQPARKQRRFVLIIIKTNQRWQPLRCHEVKLVGGTATTHYTPCRDPGGTCQCHRVRTAPHSDCRSRVSRSSIEWAYQRVSVHPS